ncbi:MAG: transporter substrate-binding domain-containing protein [Trueperaceae bacterium]
MRRIALLLLTLGIFIGFAQAQDDQDKGTLTVATDVGFAPFAMTTTQGELTGFSVDLINAMIEYLDYSDVEIVDTNFASIFAGLYASRYDFILGMVTVTEERAQEMMFSEPYLPTGLSLLGSSDSERLSSLEELEGQTLAVNSGSVSDTWATENAQSYGFEVQRYNKVADAFQAVATGRALVAMAEVPVVRYAAVQNPRLAELYFMDTNQSFAFAFRPDDSELRNEIERALECVKLDGTLAEIHREWFNSAPDAGLAAAVVHAGFGFPNLPGHSYDYHVPDCE